VLGTLAALARFSALAHVALGWGFWGLGALMMAMAAIPTRLHLPPAVCAPLHGGHPVTQFHPFCGNYTLSRNPNQF